jgi:hypothetical protein
LCAQRWFLTWRRHGLMVLALALTGGCGDAASPYRSVVRDQTRAWEEMEKILSTVTDQDSMKAARKALAKYGERFNEIQQRARNLPEPSQEVRQQVGEEAQKLPQAVDRAKEQIRRINGLPGGPEFLESTRVPIP